MFTQSKYFNLYTRITNAAKLRTNVGYTETHHIIPTSLGGPNTKENLVELTAREHFICHWLLVKMTEGEARSKMIYALQGMKSENKYQERYHTKITARVYEKYRIEHAANHSKIMKGRKAPNKGIPMSEEQKQKLREVALRRPPPSKETRAKWAASRKGYKHTEETKRKQHLALIGKPKGPMSEEQKLARSLTMKGKPKIKTHANNVRAAVLGNISINLNGIEKKVKKDTLQSWLDQGWKLGGKPRVRIHA